jgi:spermidine synthase
MADLEQRLANTAVPMNTDIRPICYPYTVTIWLTKFFPGLVAIDPLGFGTKRQGFGTSWWPVWLGLTLLFLASRLIPSWRRGILVCVAGFLGIVFEAILILTYQAREGGLYQDIGLLLAMFMAGLALGAWLLNEAIRWTGIRNRHTRRWGFGLVAGFCLLGVLVTWFVGRVSSGGLLPTSMLLAAAGFLVSGVLAYASLFSIRDQQKVITPLYTADLLGGCLGSLLVSLILIPFFGLDGTAVGMIMLAVFTVILI